MQAEERARYARSHYQKAYDGVGETRLNCFTNSYSNVVMIWDDEWKKEMDFRPVLDIECIDLDVWYLPSRTDFQHEQGTNYTTGQRGSSLTGQTQGRSRLGRGSGGQGWRCYARHAVSHPKWRGEETGRTKRSACKTEISELST